MASRPGRSGRANKIAPEVHWLRGTFRKSRHTLPSSANLPEWEPTKEQYDALGSAGRAFVGRVVADYVFTPLEGELLLEVAQVCDRLEHIRQAHGGADAAERLKLDRVEQGWLRQYASMVFTLKVQR